VVFNPTVAGEFTIDVNIVHNAEGSPSTVEIKGTGVVPPPPGRVTLISPINNANEIPIRPTLTWQIPTTGGTVAGFYVYKCDEINPPFDINNPLNRRVAELGATATSWTAGNDLEFETEYHWQVVAFNDTGKGEASFTWSFTTEPKVSDFEDVEIVVAGHALLGNFPNPFNPDTTISFVVAGHALQVNIEVFDMRGRLIRTLLDGSREFGAGIHSVSWDGRDYTGREVSSGIYLYRMVAGEYVSVRRMVLMK